MAASQAASGVRRWRQTATAGRDDRGGNDEDAKLLDATIDTIMVNRPEPTPEQSSIFCLKQEYDNPSGQEAVVKAPLPALYPSEE